MAASNAAKPRPNKNSDGQDKRPVPTMSHDINITPAPPAPAPPPPGAPQPGATNPMTHPMHPAMQSSMGTPPGGPLPGTAPPGPTAAPQDNRQVQERIQFKDMNPVEQSQTAQQQGLDPYAPLKMVQQGVVGAIQGGPSTSAIPNMLAGPYVPPGVEAFPDDFAHLSQLMSQGFAPGASNQEHEFAQNAHALAKAKIDHAMSQAQQGVGQEQAAPYPPGGAPTGPPPNVTLAPGTIGSPQGGSPAPPMPQMPPGASPAGPPLGSSMGAPPAAQGGAPGGAPPMPQPGPAGPPQMPGAPGGIPPAMIAALLAKHRPAGR